MKQKISTEEAALMCGVSKATIINRIKSGKIKAKRIGKGKTCGYIIDVEKSHKWLVGAEKSGRKKITV